MFHILSSGFMLLQKIAPMYDNMKVTFVISYPFSTLMDNCKVITLRR